MVLGTSWSASVLFVCSIEALPLTTVLFSISKYTFPKRLGRAPSYNGYKPSQTKNMTGHQNVYL